MVKLLSPKKRMRSKGPVSTKRLKAAVKKSRSDSCSPQCLKTPPPILRRPSNDSSTKEPKRRLSFSDQDDVRDLEKTPPRKTRASEAKAESPMTESKADKILREMATDVSEEEAASSSEADHHFLE